MVTPVSGSVETYRKADLRLRQLLLGDGVATTGLVRGEEFRLRVTAELRCIRDAFNNAVLESKGGRAETVEARVADLEEELQRIASLRSRTQQMWPDAASAQVDIVSPELALVDPRLAIGARELLSDPDDTIARLGLLPRASRLLNSPHP